MKFTKWLKNTYKGSNTPEEDLLNDIESDKEFPKLNSKMAILQHLENSHACSNCIRTFIRAWYEYKAENELEKMGY